MTFEIFWNLLLLKTVSLHVFKNEMELVKDKIAI